MINKLRPHFGAIATIWIIALTLAVCPRAMGQTVGAKAIPLRAANFQQAAPRGFGDRNNSWAQSMVWWKGNLYVGTSRQSLCTSWYALWQYVGLLLGPAFA